MWPKDRLLSEALCKCDHDPMEIENRALAERLRSCQSELQVFRMLFAMNKQPDAANAATNDDHQKMYWEKLKVLDMSAEKVENVLGKILAMERTKLCSICLLQMDLQRHLDDFPERDNDVTALAERVLTKLTGFYDAYRELAVPTNKALVHHRYVSSLPPSRGFSERSGNDFSFRTFDACRGCGDAASIHEKVGQAIDEVTAAFSASEMLVKRHAHYLLIEASERGSAASTAGTSQAAVSFSSDQLLGGEEGTEDVKERLTGLAAKVTVEKDLAVDDKPRIYTRYSVKGEDGPAKFDISSELLEFSLDKFTDRSDITTAFTEVSQHTRSRMGAAMDFLPDGLSEEQRTTRSALIKELDGVSKVVTNISNPSRSDGTSTD